MIASRRGKFDLNLLRDAGIAITRRQEDRPINRRRIYGFIGVGHRLDTKTYQEEPYTYDRSIDTAIAAVLYRVFFPRKGNGARLPPYDCIPNPISFFWERFEANTPFVELSAADFASRFAGPKRRMYEQVWTEMQEAVNYEYERYLRTGVFRITVFVKFEKYLKDTDPRVISAAEPWYNLATRFFAGVAGLEHALLTDLRGMFDYNPIAKGLNMDSRGQAIAEIWDSFADPIAFGGDVSRFDSCVSVTMLKEEFRCYLLYIAKNYPERYNEWKHLLFLQLRPRCQFTGDGGTFSYRNKRGQRLSGVPNTGLGNTLIQVMLVFEHFKDHLFDGRVKFVVDGDDVVFFMNRCDSWLMRGLVESYRTRGFNMVVEDPVYNLSEVEFCQCHPIWFEEGHRMIRTLNALEKDAYTINNMDDPTFRTRWLGAIAACAPSFSDVPIYRSFYKMFSRKTSSYFLHQETGLFRMVRGVGKRNDHVEDSTRFSFCVATGITPSQQVEIESAIERRGYLSERPHSVTDVIGGVVGPL